MKHLSILLVTVILSAAIIATGPIITALASPPAQSPSNPSRISSDLQGVGGFYVDGPTQMQASARLQEPIVSTIASNPSQTANNSTGNLPLEPRVLNGIYFDGPAQMQAAFGK